MVEPIKIYDFSGRRDQGAVSSSSTYSVCTSTVSSFAPIRTSIWVSSFAAQASALAAVAEGTGS